MDTSETIAEQNKPVISFTEGLRVWIKVALLSFGGPAAQIAVMHRLIVEEKQWISESRFLHALNYCMLLPGPEAQQLAIYIGWILHKTWGGIVAGVLFILPGFISILLLSMLYVYAQDISWINNIFAGLKPAVLTIVFYALFKVAKKTLQNRMLVVCACISFIAIFCFNVPFPAIIIGFACWGWLAGKYFPALFPLKAHTVPQGQDINTMTHAVHSWKRNILVCVTCGGLWIIPLIIVWLVYGTQHIFFQQGIFFSKMAMITFGGAYAVLAYMAQAAVEQYGWLNPGEMLDGLGMAESTPGPLIQVVQFVAFMGAYRFADTGDALTNALIASILVTWVTFVPCFLWIFLGAPYIEKLRGNQHITHALSAITAAVVGVIANLALWFALHTLFSKVEKQAIGAGMDLIVPYIETINYTALGISLLAAFILFFLHRGIIQTIGICVAVRVIGELL